MEVKYGNDGTEFAAGTTAVGLGNFDGLHIGHMTLVNVLLNEAKLFGLEPMIYTFTKHPENIIRKELFTPLLTTIDKKISLLGETGIKYVYFDEFDEEFSRMAPETFINEILINRLGAGLLVAGYDYRFGYKGQGNADLLRKISKDLGYRVVIVPQIKVDGEIVSSTLVRKYIIDGDMEAAFKYLGRHYSIIGKVSGGKGRGRKLGYPTANIEPAGYISMPPAGVYITKTLYEGSYYNSLTSIGQNLTFNTDGKLRIETYILDFKKDIYNCNIEVFFLERLRDEIKFENRDELAGQISRDVLAAKEYFNMP